MKILTFLAVLAMMPFGEIFAQSDQKSEKILAELSARFKAYNSLTIKFNTTITNLQSNTNSTSKATLHLKQEKYKLILPDMEIMFDGKKLYNYLSDVDEVTISIPEDAEGGELSDFQLLNPKTFYNLSSTHFKSNFVKEEPYNNRQGVTIDLYPKNIKSSHYSRIRLHIEKNTLQLIHLKAFMKSGIHYDLDFEKYVIPNPTLSDTIFTFNKKEHPTTEIIDLTF